MTQSFCGLSLDKGANSNSWPKDKSKQANSQLKEQQQLQHGAAAGAAVGAAAGEVSSNEAAAKLLGKDKH